MIFCSQNTTVDDDSQCGSCNQPDTRECVRPYAEVEEKTPWMECEAVKVRDKMKNAVFNELKAYLKVRSCTS